MVADGLEKISDLFDDIADRQIFAVYSHICIALINRNTFFVQGFQSLSGTDGNATFIEITKTFGQFFIG